MAPFDFTDLLGETLHSKGNAEVATSTLGTNGKEYVALYFTASWCPPCRAFTPILNEYYLLQHIQEKLDIVVVSSDREESAHDGYFAKMPWLSIPYADRDRVPALRAKYEVKGIPTLVLISAATGELLVKPLRSLVEKDQKGHFFPYPEKSIRTVLSKVETVTEHESFNGKSLALYFDDASSTPETRDALVEAYKESKANGHAFEVLQISWETTSEAHASHAAQVPWPTVAFDEKFDTAFHLAKLYNLSYNEPAIVVLDAARTIINKDAAIAIKKGAKFPFTALKVVDLNESSISNNFSLYEKPSLIAYLESVSDTEISRLEEILTSVAETTNASTSGGGGVVCTGDVCEISESGEPDVIFFTAKTQNEYARYYRGVAGLGEETTPDAIIYDFNNGRVAFPFRGEFSHDNLVQFVGDFKSGKLRALKEKEDQEKKAREERELKEKEEKEKAEAEE
ncbi:UNVERIFIED_CONTAM: hypothetical protein HDU68_011146 [Siphonaria sp. JEL0065]|nr:hypothetical protein HDU68_011146 [Siphonaria sp. JEL0065]